MNPAEDHACHVGSGDVCHAEVFVCHVGQGKGHGDPYDGNPAGVRMLVIVPFEYLVNDDAENDGQREEGEGAKKHACHIRVGLFEADHHGEDDDADHVVDDGGAHDGLSQLSLKLAQLTQGLYGDADGGCREDRSDEDRTVERFGSDG